MRDPEAILKEFRAPFIAAQKQYGAFPTEWIERAFLDIPRHVFIRRLRSADSGYRSLDRMNHTDEDLRTIYSDQALMIHDPPSSSSQPWLMANMLGHLDLKPGMKVLEIGTGSGFNAGLLSAGTGDPSLVYSMDIQTDLVDEAREHLRDAGVNGVHLRAADAAEGWPDAAPFDRIIATAGCPDIAPAWLDQLADGGVLLLPFSTDCCRDPVLRLTKHEGTFSGRFVVESGFMDLQGALQTEGANRISLPQSRTGTARSSSSTRELRLPNLYPDHLAFFIGGSYVVQSGTVDWLHDPVRWRLAGRRGNWTAVYDFEREQLTCSGTPGVVWNLMHRVQQWLALGKPKLTDFSVEVTDADPDPASPADWIDRRPNVRLRISLDRSRIES